MAGATWTGLTQDTGAGAGATTTTTEHGGKKGRPRSLAPPSSGMSVSDVALLTENQPKIECASCCIVLHRAACCTHVACKLRGERVKRKREREREECEAQPPCLGSDPCGGVYAA